MQLLKSHDNVIILLGVDNNIGLIKSK